MSNVFLQDKHAVNQTKADSKRIGDNSPYGDCFSIAIEPETAGTITSKYCRFCELLRNSNDTVLSKQFILYA